ncbi:hypothetical protein BGZ72_006006 [Mortierella alpina]|nr:hypothetical protein BGZ72_006006 [Mortierella alpina]
MKFSTLAVLAAFVMVAAAQDDGVISINPITSDPTESATGPASPSATATASRSATVVPVPTNVPTVVPSLTPSSSVVPVPSPTKPASSGNALNIPVKAMAAIGGGAALLAQLL